MKLYEIKNYLLDDIGTYSVETDDKEYVITLPSGIDLLEMVLKEKDIAIYDLLKEYEVKYIYLAGNARFGVCLEDCAANTLQSLGNLLGDKLYKEIKYSVLDDEDNLDLKEDKLDFDLEDIDLPF